MGSNIIFDGNYILHKNIFTLLKTNTLYGDLYNALTNNILKYKAMYNWSNIFIASDSRKKSWRKELSDKYKANRVRVEEIDWDFIFKTYDEWKKDMSEQYIVLESDTIEGDDWITSILYKYNKKGYSNVVISSDKDMNQLIDYNLKNNWINFQISDINGKEKITLPEGWELWYNEFENTRSTDVFNLDDGYNWITFFNKLKNNWDYETVNKYEKLFIKLMMGDKGDNIDSIYQTLTKSGKLLGIGASSALKLWNFYKDNYKNYFNTDEENFINDIINCIEQVKNIKLHEEKKKIITSNLIQNISLMELHYKHYPEQVMEKIINEMNNKIYS